MQKNVEHIGDSGIYACASCDTLLTTIKEMLSSYVTMPQGNAMLFDRVQNLKYGSLAKRMMTSGIYYIRDVTCRRCALKLGFYYETSVNKANRDREGKVALALGLITMK